MIFEDYKKYLLAGVAVSSDQQPNPIAGLKTRRCLSCSGWLILLILFDVCTQGCKKFVQIPPPNTLLVTTNVFNNNSTATSALTSIYTQMFTNSESFNIAQDLGLLADELTNYSTSAVQVEFYTNAMTATSITGEWDNAYNYIYRANAVIAALQNNGNISPAVAQQLTGESLFLRAFWHFYLTNEYGAVPLVTTTLYTVNESISRTPQALVYAQIIQDLKNAQSLLNANYVDGSDTTVTTERTRPTKAAAQALLARVYLYTGKYDSAQAQATLVINNTNLYALDSILSPTNSTYSPNSPFLMNSTEAIWQLYTPQPSGDNTNDAQNFYLAGVPSTGTDNSTTISPQLLSSFEAGDLRRANWIDSIIESGILYYFPYKYQSYNTNTLTEYTMVLRLAEQYLIRAEAEANLGDMAGAARDLNTVRARAGLGQSPTLTASSSLQQADSAILHERQVELFTEWGHRWFDLIRTGTVNTVLGSPGNVCRAKGGVWSSISELFPIPEYDILADPNLTQNPGY
jgi:starch-binding outer membrane protein, SusD/RagB family